MNLLSSAIKTASLVSVGFVLLVILNGASDWPVWAGLALVFLLCYSVARATDPPRDRPRRGPK